MNSEISTHPIVRGIHMLIAYIHLELAGVRHLSDFEWETILMISDWADSRGK